MTYRSIIPLNTQIQKIVLIIGVCLFALLIGGISFLKWVVEPKLISKLEKVKGDAFIEGYHIDFKDTYLDILDGDFVIDSLLITRRRYSQKNVFSTAALVPDTIASKVSISGFRAYQLLMNDAILLSDIQLESPFIVLRINDSVQSLTIDTMVIDTYQSLGQFSCSNLSMSDASFKIKENTHKELFDVQHINLTWQELSVDLSNPDSLLQSINYQSFVFLSDSLIGAMGDVQFLIEDLYIYSETNGTGFNVNSNRFSAKQVDGIELHGKSIFISELMAIDWLSNRTLAFRNAEVDVSKLYFPKSKRVIKKVDMPIDTDILDSLCFDMFSLRIDALYKQSSKNIVKGEFLEIRLDSVKKSFTSFSQLGAELLDQTYFNWERLSTQINDLYRLQIDSVQFTKGINEIGISGVHLIPLYSKKVFSKHIKHEQVWYDMHYTGITITGIDEQLLVNDMGLACEEIRINECVLNLFRDKWVEDPPFTKQLMIGSLLKSSPSRINIDKLNIRKADIRYEQLGDIVQTDDPGTITFDNSSIYFSNITNDPKEIEKNPLLMIHFQSHFMNHGVVHSTLNCHLNRLDDYFTLTTKMDTFPAVYLNPILGNLVYVNVPYGQIHNVLLVAEGNDDYIKGVLDIEYEDIKVETLRVNNPEKHAALLKLIANMAIRRSNLKTNKQYKRGDVFAFRKKEKSIISLIWVGLKSGLTDVMIPLYPNKEKKAFEKQNR